jgi:GMP synthase (glutamine-hydrolysing)
MRPMSSQENDGTRPRLLVVQPDPQDPLDRFAGLLTDAGLAVRVLQPFAKERLPDRLEEDGLLVLGGRMSVIDDDKYPWLADIRRLLRHAVELLRPALGICLGGQLLAQAFGGTVTAGDRGVEAGLVRVRWRVEAQADTLFANLPTPFLAGALHDDMVKTLPKMAVWLGHSDIYPHQAFRVGPYAWGLQFHPEVSVARYREWVSARGGTDPAAWLRMTRGAAEFQRLDDDVLVGISVLARRFANLVRALSAGEP